MFLFFCTVLIPTSNVQLHLSTLQVKFFFCFFSTLEPRSLLSSKKKYVCFFFEITRFAASFCLLDHTGENHASAQLLISTMLCTPKIFFFGAGLVLILFFLISDDFQIREGSMHYISGQREYVIQRCEHIFYTVMKKIT